MLKGAIARRYAEAVFQLAQKQNTLERTVEEVQEMGKLFANRKLAYLLSEPKVSAKRKEAALREALEKRVLATSLNLALLIVQRRLVEAFPAIARELQKLLLDYRNQAIAVVTTASEMDPQQRDQVQKALERRTGKEILIETRTEAGILGGVIAQVGDQVIDGSIRRRLEVLRQDLDRSITSTDTQLFSLDEIKAQIGKEDTDPDITRSVPSKA